MGVFEIFNGTLKKYPSEFKEGPHSVIVDFNLKNGDKIEIKMQPNNPVETVSWNEVIEWIKGLNDLSQNGDEFIQKELQRVVPGHLQGDVYALPTEAHWTYVMQNLEKNNKKYFSLEDNRDVKNYAVYGRNSKIADYQGTPVSASDSQELALNILNIFKIFY